MNKHADSPEGYIIYEDGGTSPITYGASEEWFKTYDEAMGYALSIVKKRIRKFKKYIDCNSVVVYEGSKELLRQSHSCPSGRVVFYWNNYKS